MAKKKLVSSAEVNAAEETFVAFMAGKLTRMGAAIAAAKFRSNGPLRKRQTKKWLQRFADDGGDVGDMASFMAWLLDHADEIIALISKIILLFALSLLLMFGLASPANAQIVAPEESKLGEPIVASIESDAPEGAKVVYDWRSGAGVSFLPVDEGRSLHVWAKPGTHRLECTVATQVIRKIVVFVPDPEFPTDVTKAKLQTLEIAESLDVKRHEATFKVEGGTPEPEPPKPLPEPTPGTLGALVPAAARAPLAEFYADLAGVVRAGGFKTTSHFREGYRLAIKTSQDAGRFPVGVSAIDKPISDRIAVAITLAETPLDAAKVTALAAALDSISAEFRG